MLPPINVHLIGIDCATEDSKIGLALGHLGAGGLAVSEAKQCTREQRAADLVTGWVGSAQGPVLLAIDAPLGWPVALSEALVAHIAGEQIHAEPHHMFRRFTDRFIQKNFDKTPLDVGADRIARTAHAALGLLGELRQRLSSDLPLAWSPDPIAALSAIEVYPAVTLLSHGMTSRGYKKPRDVAERGKIIRSLRTRLDLPENIVPRLSESADALDAVVCLLAGADFLLGNADPPEDLALARREGWIWVRRRAAA